MHDSIGVLKIHSSDGLIGFNEALEELVSPWGNVESWWQQIRHHFSDARDRDRCEVCGEREVKGTFEIKAKTPGAEQIDFRVSFHGHTHNRESSRTTSRQETGSIGIVERGAIEVPDDEGTKGLEQLSEVTTPETFEALGLSSASSQHGLSEQSTPGEIALAYVRRALSWPLRSALRQLDPLVQDLGSNRIRAKNDQIVDIYRATESLLELVQDVDSRDPDHKQRKFLDALRSLATGMSQSLDIDQVAHQIFECFNDLLGFQRGAIVVNKDGDIDILADRGGGETLKAEIAPAAWLQGVHQAEPELIVTDPAFRDALETDLDATADALLGDEEMPKTTDSVDVWIALPLVGRDGETFGCLGLHRKHPSDQRLTIESYDRQLLSALADQAALAILNAWKYEEARREANTDPLTELYGRRYMERRTHEAMLHAANTGGDLSLLMVDIDHFKKVNDEYGHVVGDAILEKVANRCRDVLRDGDLVGRYGGEEFVCLLPGADLTSAKEAGERLRHSVRSRPFSVDGHDVSIKVTVGVARFTEDVDDFESFVERADSALYSAKRAGRDQVAIYEDVSQPTAGQIRPS